MKKIITIIVLFFTITLPGYTQSAIHYYGWNPQYSHSPSDIIQASDGSLLIMGDVQSSQPLIENYVFKQYLVKTNSKGDTLWTKYHDHDSYGSANIFETPSNTIVAYGSISRGNMCGIIGTTVPYTGVSLQTFTSFGNSLSLNQYNDQCSNVITDKIKKSSGGLTALMNFSDNTHTPSYAIKEISSTGIINTIALPSDYGNKFEKAGNGYWIAGYSKLYKVSLNGSLLWQKPMTFTPGLADFCKLNNDSLLLACSSWGDSVNVKKTDSIGNQVWSKIYHLKANHIMFHSNGNYILTGKSGSDLVVLALNSNGDSIWSKKHSLSMPAIGIKTIEMSNGKIATLAYSGGIGLASQYALVLDSVGSLVSIKENNSPKNIYIKNYPNPFTDNTTFVIQSDKLNEAYSFELLDVLGKQVRSINEITTKEFQLSRNGLPNGIYFYKIYNFETVIGIGKLVLEF